MRRCYGYLHMVRTSQQTTVSSDTESVQVGIPLVIHGKGTIGRGLQRLIAERAASALRGIGSRVERLTVRFEDLNGPKGGVDMACRIQLVLSSHPVIVVEGRAEDSGRAFRLALPRLIAAIDRQLNRRSVKSRNTLRESFARAS